MRALTLRFTMALIAGLLISNSAHALTYSFSYTFDSSSGYPGFVNGSFDGNASGNLITNLTNIFVNQNGTPFNGSGSLYGSHYVGNTWVSGGAIASFDGTQNNFLFVDVDLPNSYSYTNYFYAIPIGTTLTNDAIAFAISGISYDVYNANRWSVTQANPVPEPATMVLLGTGLVGLAVYRRKTRYNGSNSLNK